MKCSAGKAARKSTFGLSRCDQTTIGAVLVLLMISAMPAQAYLTTRVPLPKPRPAEMQQIEPESSMKDSGQSGVPPAQPENEAADQKSTEQKSPKPPPPSACRLALGEDIAIAPSIPDINGPGACGGPDLVRLEAIVLLDKTRVPLKPAATMRCSMAAAVADWVRTDMAPLAGSLNTKLLEIDNFDSFSCRGRNRVQGAKLSEHGRANALDVRGLRLANGQTIALTERNTPRVLREKVLLSLCTRFPTVLGPGSDGFHEDHIHFDLAERRGGYRICQWDVWDPWPQIAPLMPAPRPAEAPQRETAEGRQSAPEERPGAQPAPAQSEAQAELEKAQQAEEAKSEQPKAKPGQQSTAKAKKPRKQRAQAPFPLDLLR